jgi:hypothetical protein
MLWCGLFVEVVLLIVLQKKLYGCNLKKQPADGAVKQE